VTSIDVNLVPIVSVPVIKIIDIHQSGGLNPAAVSIAHARRNKARFGPLLGRKELIMTLLKWALIVFLISVVAAVFGFTDVAGAAAVVARVLFYIFLVIFLVLLVLGLIGRCAPSDCSTE
jgi:uncharacterized membrane protein YtjA (UPF0391 family)